MLTAICLNVSGKEDRVDILYYLQAEKKWTNASAYLYGEWCMDWSRPAFTYYYIQPGMNWKLCDWLNATASCCYIWDSGHPYALWPAAGLSMTLHAGRFSFRLSESFVYSVSLNDAPSKPFLRTRAGVSFTPAAGPFRPLIWCESYSWDRLIRLKMLLGTDIRISRALTLNVSYLRSEIHGRDYSLNHLVLGLSYGF